MVALGRLLWRNTITNYIRLFLNLFGAIFVTRIIFLGMGEQLYGFWSLLWAVFGYSLLLDFGFGRTVQKYTAEKDFSRNPHEYNQIITVVFGTYLVEALLIAAVAVGLSFFLPDIFKLAPGADLHYYRLCFLVFGLGIAVVFPSGIVIEILTGMNRIDLRNFALIGNKLMELIGIYIIFRCGGSLLTLAIFTAVLNLSTNLVVLVMVLRLQPQLRLAWNGFNRKILRKIADFSFFSYALTIADLINQKTDRLVLGIMVGVGGVSCYQVGTRVPEMASFLSSQFQESLSPLAAAMHKSGEHERLRRIMVGSTRLTVFISTGAFVTLGALAPAILQVWLKVNSTAILQVAYVMLFSGYLLVAVRSVPTQCLLMAG
ncbi:MAG: oligosaccharide flippase family protein, partial [Victivallales bacterium]|nr:oligosaccharide flippase family protein [Victivallales bacterium]